MSTCEPCALRDRCESERADVIERNRAYRLLSAVLRGAEEEQGSMALQIGHCRDCAARLVAIYMGLLAGVISAVEGSEEAAAAWVDRQITDLPPDAPE